MKKTGNSNLYDSAITIENIRNIWKIVRKTCKNKKAVCQFELNENANIHNIYRLLKDKKYKPSVFNVFLIFEPKPRLVMSQNVLDKIVNHFITNYYLMPSLEHSLVDCNVATRKKKGSKYGIELLEKYINTIRLNNKNKEIYCLKIDISKYFYSINHRILLDKLKVKINDQYVLGLVKQVISETNKDYINEAIDRYNQIYGKNIPNYKDGVGLSIGAMTSQFLAIFYLNDIDHYIKEILRCKYYVRYMDDFIILDTDREKLKMIFKDLTRKIEKHNLKVNPKSEIHKLSNGITFLGYRYKIVDSKLNVNYSKKTANRLYKKLLNLKKYNLIKYYKSYASYYGYLKKVKIVRRNFNMKTKEKYDYYKGKHQKSIVMIKEGSFYKTYDEDAIILWHIFGYKWNNDCISFGSTPHMKVLDKLTHLGFNYVVVKENPISIDNNNEEIYDLYLQLATINFKKHERKYELLELLEQVLDKKIDLYDEIKCFLLNLQ